MIQFSLPLKHRNGKQEMTANTDGQQIAAMGERLARLEERDKSLATKVDIQTLKADLTWRLLLWTGIWTGVLVGIIKWG